MVFTSLIYCSSQGKHRWSVKLEIVVPIFKSNSVSFYNEVTRNAKVTRNLKLNILKKKKNNRIIHSSYMGFINITDGRRVWGTVKGAGTDQLPCRKRLAILAAE